MTISDPRPTTDTRTPLGIPPLDDLLGGGLTDGTLTLIAGLSGVGKSALACQAVRHAALARDLPGYYAPLEGDQRTALSRVLSAETGIEHHRFADPTRQPFTLWERDRIDAAGAHLKRSALHIDTRPRNIADLQRRLARIGSRPPRIAVVDYPTALAAMAPDFADEITRVGLGLKHVAQRYAMPVIVTCPLNRSRTDKLGEIGQFAGLLDAADNVLILRRPDDHAPPARIDIAKSCRGVTGSVGAYFEAQFVRFWGDAR